MIKGIGINTGELGAQISDNLQGKSDAEKTQGRVIRTVSQNFATNMSTPKGNLATMKSTADKINTFVRKNIGLNRTSSGMAEYIIEWVKSHPYLEDKEFDRFMRSSGMSPEQGRETLYRYIQDLKKSMPKKIKKFVQEQESKISMPTHEGTYGMPMTGSGVRP